MLATTIEQGKRLLACGIDSATSDMNHIESREEVVAMPYYKMMKQDFPAWSLTALLTKVLPARIRDKYTLRIEVTSDGWHVSYVGIGAAIVDSEVLITEDPTPIEACVKMAEKLSLIKRLTEK